jgi:hypothetical protein
MARSGHPHEWPAIAMPACHAGRFTGHMAQQWETAGEFTIGARFNGPPTTANGGYAGGVIARFVDGPAKVRLRRPPPLEARLVAMTDGHHIRVLDGETLVAEAEPAHNGFLEPPLRPSLEQALAATRRHPWRGVRHLLSDCFVCGPDRPDGLGVTPGPVTGADEVTAAPFVPDDSVANDGIVDPAVVWATLDCPSFPAEAMRAGRIALLGTLEARLERDVTVGERLVVVGWTRALEGRKLQSASALIAENRSIVAQALATWIAPETPVTVR